MKGLVLNSGGIDSPVAAYFMRDYDLEAVHFDNQPYSEGTTTIATKIIETLSQVLNKEIPQYTVSHGENLSAFMGACGREGKKYTCVFCKRMMLRMAERIAWKKNCDFLITGENLGQVASQTLQIIYVISQAVDIPIVRPLIGLDKLDIITVAEEIGTYSVSIEKAPLCSAVPQYPSVRAQLKRIEDIESGINIEGLVRKAVDTMVCSLHPGIYEDDSCI